MGWLCQSRAHLTLSEKQFSWSQLEGGWGCNRIQDAAKLPHRKWGSLHSKDENVILRRYYSGNFYKWSRELQRYISGLVHRLAITQGLPWVSVFVFSSLQSYNWTWPVHVWVCVGLWGAWIVWSVCVYAYELVGIWVCTQACGSLYHAWTWCLKPLGIACLAREFLGTTCPPNPMVTGTHSHACFVLLFLVFYGCRGFKLSSSYFQVLIPVPTPQSSGLGYFQWDLLL